MASLPKTGGVTYEEWLRMPEVSDVIEEVVNGEIRTMPLAKLKHLLIVDRLHTAFKNQLGLDKFRAATGSFELVTRKQPPTCRAPGLAAFEWNSIVEQIFSLENCVLRQSKFVSEGLLKSKHFPGDQIDVAAIWPA